MSASFLVGPSPAQVRSIALTSARYSNVLWRRLPRVRLLIACVLAVVVSGAAAPAEPLTRPAEAPRLDFPIDATVKENLALASLGATATSDSELEREKGCTPQVIDGIVGRNNRWHSSITTPHPHWVQVKLAKPARIGWVILHFADSVGAAIEFRGLVLQEGGAWREVFHVKNHNDPKGWRGQVKPVTTDKFKVEILSSHNPVSANAAQLSEIELCPPGNLTPNPVAAPVKDVAQRPESEEPRWSTDPAEWKPVAQKLAAPVTGVTLAEKSLWRATMDKHTEYLLSDAQVDDMVFRFRKVAGIANPPGSAHGWEGRFPAHAAQFLMGAGNTLRWGEDERLRTRMNELINALEALKTPDGELQAPYGGGEAGYSFMLLAHGLEAAGQAGNKDAVDVLNAWAKWYRKDDGRMALGGQNYFAATALMIDYFYGKGPQDDVLIAYKHIHPRWMRQLDENDPEGIWRAANGHPHSAYCYGWLGYLDMYRATGDPRLINALRNGWALYRDHWQHAGGQLAICEGGVYPPDSQYITPQAHTGETCSMVWWAKFNQRMHQLYPDDERFPAEVEKVIYNVGLPNLRGKAICYHTDLEGHKGAPGEVVHHCCEVVGTYLYSTLPEYVYSLSDDGIWVNQFAPATIKWNAGGSALELAQTSNFPFDNKVQLALKTAHDTPMKIRLRVPGWAAGEMAVSVNGQPAGTGKPGSYLTIDRTWKDRDKIEFTLPAELRAMTYTGADQIPGARRYALMYGPVLMAALTDKPQSVELPPRQGKDSKPPKTMAVPLAFDPQNAKGTLLPAEHAPLEFRTKDGQSAVLKPYFLLEPGQNFTCYPMVPQPAK